MTGQPDNETPEQEEAVAAPQVGDAILTRQQGYMRAALKNVQAITGDSSIDPKLYGGLCHTLPILVRVDGLCQALAFVADKASAQDGPRARAYGALLKHVGELFGESQERVLEKVRDAPLTEYMLLTRRLLDAWIFYKRFAVSILGVTDAAEVEKEGA